VKEDEDDNVILYRKIKQR